MMLRGLIVGLGAAVEYLSKVGMVAVASHEQALTRLTLELLAKNGDVTIYGPRNPEIKGAVVAFNVRGLHPHDVAHLLDQEGIAVRAGHHCAMPLMRRLGVVGTVRASFSVHTTPGEIEHLARSLSNLNLML